MQQQHLWQFLSQKQRKDVLQAVEDIISKCPLPVCLQTLAQKARKSTVADSIKQIDPKAQIIISRLIKRNQYAVCHTFSILADSLISIMKETVSEIEEEKSIKCIGPRYCNLVDKICNSHDFEWRIWVPARGSLWLRVQEETQKLLKGTLGFMIRHFKVTYLPVEDLVDKQMEQIKKELKEVSKKWEQIHCLQESVVKSLIKLGNEEHLKENQESDLEMVFSKIEMLEIEMEKGQKNDKAVSKSAIDSEGDKSIISKIKSAGKSIYGKLSSYMEPGEVASKSPEEFQDIEGKKQLTKEETNFVQKLSSCTFNQLEGMLMGKLNEQDKWNLEYLLRLPLLKWEQAETVVFGTEGLVQENSYNLFEWSNRLEKSLQNLIWKQRKQSGIFLVLTGYFYQSLKKDYGPLTRRYLIKVLEGLEKLYGADCPYLRGALRVYQRSCINPTIEALRLEQQMPFRSPSFEESDKSRYSRQKSWQSEGPKAKAKLQEESLIDLQRLTYAPPCKNVTFLISGYLSEQTEKDLQWQGIIRCLEDTEVYGVLWRSSTPGQLVKYAAQIGVGVVLKGMGASVPIAAGVAHFGLNLVKGFIKKDGQSKQKNPFWNAYGRAANAGSELADQIMRIFPDRHITLVGFSMGTEVVRNCVEQLAKHKKLSLLSRVVTFGGVADQESVEQLLKRCNHPLSWINFKSRKDYAVRYLFRLVSWGGRPIGWGGVKAVEGHEVENIEVSELVSGHMGYRKYLYGLCMLRGLNNE